MNTDRVFLSVVIPTLNEAEVIGATLQSIKRDVIAHDMDVEIIVVDAGSIDETCTIAADQADSVVVSAKGRAQQMNCGAALAQGQLLLFLHADTLLPKGFLSLIKTASQRPAKWGFFHVKFDGQHWLLSCVARLMNARSGFTSVATGDQGLFIERRVFLRLGGFAAIPLMEDIELSKRLRKISLPAVINTKLTTSSRRWETGGVIKTILLMWRLRLLYVLGVKPQVLAKYYR